MPTINGETTVADQISNGQFQALDARLRGVRAGSLLLGVPALIRRAALAASPYSLATLQVITLPPNAKASTILRATARAGTATPGELAVQPFGTTPATGQVAVTPSGDIAFLAADAWTDVDVHFVPDVVEWREFSLPVSSHVLALPAEVTARGVVMLQQAEVTEGTTTGKKVVLVPGAGAPATGQARLNLAKTTITFATADAATRARVVIGVAFPSSYEALSAPTPFI